MSKELTNIQYLSAIASGGVSSIALVGILQALSKLSYTSAKFR
ncbi:hypothetical protein ACQFX9_12260 [Aliinostoc sp. HNIBRCY26]